MPAANNDLVLVTCASGQQASALLPLLVDCFRLRLACHSDDSAKKLRSQYPQAEVLQPDLPTHPNACSC